MADCVIDVCIELNSSVISLDLAHESDRKALEDHINQYIHDLIKDLDVCAEISLRVTFDQLNNSFSQFIIRINDRKCRLPLTTTITADANVVELARLMTKAIYENRELILTPQIIEKILKKRLAVDYKMQSSISSDMMLYESQIELVRNSFRISRCKFNYGFTEKTRDHRKVTRIFEESISSITITRKNVSWFLGMIFR